METSRALLPPPADVVVAGLGNIGSQVVSHLGRLPQVRRVTLIDRDRYESANLLTQHLQPADVGQPKAVAQARALQALRPDLCVTALVADLADVPLASFRARVLVAGLDSLAARLIVNQAAWRLGLPWLDGGVEPASGLVRVNAYLPDAASPCLECALDEADYASLPARYACGGAEAPSTRGPSALGGLAAALLAAECDQFLATGTLELFGRQVVLDAAHHRYFLTGFRRNPRCRFDHATWQFREWPELHGGWTVEQFLAQARECLPGPEPVAASLEGKYFVRSLHCAECGHKQEDCVLEGRLDLARTRCPACGRGALQPSVFRALHELDAQLPVEILHRRLAALGLRAGDVLRVKAGAAEMHVVIPHDPA